MDTYMNTIRYVMGGGKEGSCSTEGEYYFHYNKEFDLPELKATHFKRFNI